MSNLLNLIPKKISKKEATDTGMAMVLICLLLGYFLKNNNFYLLALPVQVINMVFSKFFTPFAYIWLGLTNLLGAIVSKVLLSVIYILFLMPMGIIRRMMGKDSLKLKGFKQSKESVMITRDIVFTAEDIKNPF